MNKKNSPQRSLRTQRGKSDKGAPFRCTHGFAAYSFVFWFNHATDVFPAMLTFPLENQVFAIHFCGLEDDWYRAETSAAENTVEDLLLRPFGYFLPPESGLSRVWFPLPDACAFSGRK